MQRLGEERLVIDTSDEPSVLVYTPGVEGPKEGPSGGSLSGLMKHLGLSDEEQPD